MLSLFAAALYYHPWAMVMVTGVIVTVICVIIRRRRKISGLIPSER
jgi:uncharacterized membrane protein (DUF106 family)